MDRYPFHADDRDARIAELTEQLVRAWNLRLQAGEQRAISDLHNCMLDRLSADDAKALFVQAATSPAGADAAFTALVTKTVRDVCEADATRCVDNIAKDRAEARDADRIARAIENRVFA